MRRLFFIVVLSCLTLCFYPSEHAVGAPAAKASVKKKTLKKSPAKETPEQKKKKEQEARFLQAENALYAYNLQNALPELAVLCEQEYLRACSLLGFAYTAGRYGIRRDWDTGITWYEKCAKYEKNFFCSNELGLIYYRDGDYHRAFEYYNAGAKGGNARAQYLLGKLYLEGKGLPANAENAVLWLRRAAHNTKNPEKQAQCLMTELSYYGIGMRQSLKDTDYWLKKCDSPFIRAQKFLYGHGVTQDRKKAKEILQTAGLKEALGDWNDFLLNSAPSVGVKTMRDSAIPEDCAAKEFVFGAGRKNPKIETYTVKIFHKNFYRTFDVRDGFSEKNGSSADQTFEACGMTFYTTKENKLLFNKSLKANAVIKISQYTNACFGAEITGVCDLNLPWKEEP